LNPFSLDVISMEEFNKPKALAVGHSNGFSFTLLSMIQRNSEWSD
jgi:hypothetical protein